MKPQIVDCTFRPPTDGSPAKPRVEDVPCGFDPDKAPLLKPAEPTQKPAQAPARK